MAISFHERIAIVTGAGGGLGRAYALELARRGAKIVVNDLSSAEAVVEEIRAAGGQAMADAGSVTDPEAMAVMVAKAREAWGGVHILINNAGILRDKSFSKMTIEDFKLVIDVHLNGAAIATKAVWDVMRAQNYGRILMTASSTGLYGNFGQANYGAAKLGLAGLAKTLHLEGAKYNITCNTIAPVAATQMTQGILPPEDFQAFAPEHVVPVALYLVSEEAPTNAVIGAGAGLVHAANITMTRGVLLPADARTPEGVAAHWSGIIDRTAETVPDSGTEQTMAIIARLHAATSAKA
jgi:NAD(P)-dependent dehydrogenase (short-subunit alcohol dehydrogenase family)